MMNNQSIASILATPPQGSTGSSAQTSSSGDAVKKFMDYMKETPAQRWVDQWLAAHHLTQKDLDAMSPTKRAAIEKEMANDIKMAVEQATKKKFQGLSSAPL